ncbi:tetratricopeptide repeat protein [Pyxidicoccus xibeiensis]|uniref:tetratricopeptide repeat protein n=1 Tax=Pyxidicoccus xibeiensis TaxID=2906759 RepID=UPI0020A76840|nr:hypothetical protein [Pyxidicoccus xibeiensis]MCP3137288.1 hypothetical protein [Pyxidicoccus xibeiensis]
MIRDPAEFLQRIPELRALCEDAGVRRAVERGDPFKLYRALRWARWLGRLRSHRQVLDTLLRQRRLFARPLKQGGLFLGTFNGFGATLLGSAEPDAEDGTSIATHAVVALFAVPLLPLGAYVVRPADSNNPLSRSWTFFARVPLGTLPWLWGRVVALSVIALVATGAARAFHASRYRDVYVANAFEQPLSVTLGGRTLTVAPRQVATLTVPLGTQRAVAVSPDGVQVDAVELNVRAGPAVQVWNIAGGMPVLLRDVVYSSMPSANDGSPATVYCGQRFIELAKVDDVFVEPPLQLSTRSGGSTTRRYLGIATEEGVVPLELCSTYLLSQDRLGETLPFSEVAARLSGWGEAEVSRALQAALASGPGALIRFTRSSLEARPKDPEAHRLYQWAVEREGNVEELLSEYAARARAEPDSADAQYLHARLLRGAARAGAMERLAERFPDHSDTLRSVAHHRYLAGKWEGSVKAWERLRALDAETATNSLDEQVAALVALGRPAEALALLADLFKSDDAQLRRTVAELHALVAARTGQGQPDALVAALEQEHEGKPFTLLRVRAHLPLKEAPQFAGERLMSVIGKEPGAALEEARALKEFELPSLTEVSWALAYGEAVRTASEESERSLSRAYVLSPRQREDFRRFVRGESAALDPDELSPEVRAAAYFVRSRDTSLPEAERRKLVVQARRDDGLHGSVSEAISAWTP